MGAGNPTISQETETQVPAACQPQPRQPLIIKLIPQLQKPTIKISDTWIIDSGKRETRYHLVKVHQTIRQPHKYILHFLIKTPYYIFVVMLSLLENDLSLLLKTILCISVLNDVFKKLYTYTVRRVSLNLHFYYTGEAVPYSGIDIYIGGECYWVQIIFSSNY